MSLVANSIQTPIVTRYGFWDFEVIRAYANISLVILFAFAVIVAVGLMVALPFGNNGISDHDIKKASLISTLMALTVAMIITVTPYDTIATSDIGKGYGISIENASRYPDKYLAVPKGDATYRKTIRFRNSKGVEYEGQLIIGHNTIKLRYDPTTGKAPKHIQSRFKDYPKTAR